MFLPIFGEAKRLVVVHLTDAVELLVTSEIAVVAEEFAVIAANCVVQMVFLVGFVPKSALTTVFMTKFVSHAFGLVS